MFKKDWVKMVHVKRGGRCFGIWENMNENDKGRNKILVEILASQSVQHYKMEECLGSPLQCTEPKNYNFQVYPFKNEWKIKRNKFHW